jgi:hypothetical protein
MLAVLLGACAVSVSALFDVDGGASKKIEGRTDGQNGQAS